MMMIENKEKVITLWIGNKITTKPDEMDKTRSDKKIDEKISHLPQAHP